MRRYRLNNVELNGALTNFSFVCEVSRILANYFILPVTTWDESEAEPVDAQQSVVQCH
jgi:hypothetical protein